MNDSFFNNIVDLMSTGKKFQVGSRSVADLSSLAHKKSQVGSKSMADFSTLVQGSSPSFTPKAAGNQSYSSLVNVKIETAPCHSYVPTCYQHPRPLRIRLPQVKRIDFVDTTH